MTLATKLSVLLLLVLSACSEEPKRPLTEFQKETERMRAEVNAELKSLCDSGSVSACQSLNNDNSAETKYRLEQKEKAAVELHCAAEPWSENC